MLINKNKKIFFLAAFLLLPFVTHAQLTLATSNFADFVYQIVDILDLLIPVMMTAAGVVFIWGISKVVLHSGSSTEVTSGKNYILWAIIAMFCLVSLSGIIYFIQDEIGFGAVKDRGLILLPSSQ
ncbi:MAG: hypothetical protein WAW92_01625 [Minisyncoccia bacterium]